MKEKKSKVYFSLLKKTIQNRTVCVFCTMYAQTLHHIDENQKNNNTKNLIPVCQKCHLELKHQKDKFPRFISPKNVNFKKLKRKNKRLAKKVTPIIDKPKKLKKVKPLVNRICAICKKTFITKNYWQKYCGKKCRLLAWGHSELKKMGIISLVFLSTSAFAFTNGQIADAIYKAENSAKYPYGIKSIDTHGDKAYARKICLNTIRNHRKRHANHKCKLDFITCLGNRYCPPTAHKLNVNWVFNVKRFLTRG